jgi:hypothetical protein
MIEERMADEEEEEEEFEGEPKVGTVKNLRTPCCRQVTKTKDSYLCQTLRSAEIIWRAGDRVTAGELTVLAKVYAVDSVLPRELSLIGGGGGGGQLIRQAPSHTHTLAPLTSHTFHL